MRLWCALLALGLVGCAGPPSDGGLWARQALHQEEQAIFKTPDPQRAAAARAVELHVIDDLLAHEQQRLDAQTADCPGQVREPLALSPGNTVRDAVRARTADEPARQATLASLALRDWRLRRARQTGEPRFCQMPNTPSTAARMDLGTASVARDTHATVPDVVQAPDVAFARYVLGWADGVRTQSPLPQYLARVYGGRATPAVLPSAWQNRPPADLVDELAPAYPEFEPDALWLALDTKTE